MNDSQLDARLRAALPARSASASLASTIDDRLQRHRRIHRIVRPLRLAFALGATGLGIVVLGPPVYAQSVMGRIAGAIDGVSSLRMTRTSVDAQGNRYPAGESIYREGQWRMRMPNGDMLFRHSKAYVLDPALKVYVQQAKPNGPFANGTGIRLSEMLGVASKWSLDRRVAVDDAVRNGRPMKRAIVQNGGLGERYVIFADPKTDLPSEVLVEAWEGGAWRLRTVQKFEYGASIPTTAFELPKGAVVISESERSIRTVRAMTSKQLAEMPLRKGRVVIRAVDVARDGTVFVAYQAGDRVPNRWRGYGLELRDDRGTAYGRQMVIGLGEDFVKRAKDGKLEVEAFVPLEPVDPRQPRTYTVTASRMKTGEFTRWIDGVVQDPNGPFRMVWQPNWQSSDRTPPTKKDVLRLKFAAPTCDSMPAFATMLSPTNFGNEITTAIYTASVRGRTYAERKEWGAAKRWYEEALLQMRKHERTGLGPWSEEPVLAAIRSIDQRTWTPL